MHVELGPTYCRATLDDGERFYAETAFWHALKQALREQGHDVVKKIMAKDGHLYGGDNGPYYLRDRRWRFCVYDGHYAVRDLAKHATRERTVTLIHHRWERQTELPLDPAPLGG